MTASSSLFETLGASSPADPSRLGFDPTRLERILAFFNREVGRGAIPGAVLAIAREGQLVSLNTFGYRHAAAAATMKADTIFRIASMTKPVTAVAAMTLVEAGWLHLAEPVCNFIPEFRGLNVARESIDGRTGEPSLTVEPARRDMTIHDLFRHTSGLTYGDFGNSLVQQEYRKLAMMDHQQTNEEMVLKLATLPLRFHPGTTFEYGMSLDVLGRVIEIVSGMDLQTFIRERVSGPLGMKDTAFGVSHGIEGRLALPFPDAMPMIEKATASPIGRRPIRWHMGGGGLLSTVPDYLQFAQMLMNGGTLGDVRILSKNAVHFMTSDHLPADIAFSDTISTFGSVAPMTAMGQSFGLGMVVRTALGRNPDMGAVGDFYWPGITGTTFWVDPTNSLVVVLMLQSPATRARYRSVVRNLVYQALVN